MRKREGDGGGVGRSRILFPKKYLYIFHFCYRRLECRTVEITTAPAAVAADEYSYVTLLNTCRHLHILLHELRLANRSIRLRRLSNLAGQGERDASQ